MTPRRRQDTPLRATLRTWVAIVWLFVIAAGNAKATWSIVAVDNETGEVGIAGASCISSSYVIAGVSPGYGVIAAQAYLSLRGRDRGVQLLADRATPSEVIELLTASRQRNSDKLMV